MASAFLSVLVPGVTPDVETTEAEQSQRETASLRVTIDGFRNANGRAAIALFDDPEAFPEQSRAAFGKVSSIKGGVATVTFEDIEPGVYAVAVLHDENLNDKMDFNLVGMPLEGYGFSNDASGTFGPPDFEEAAFRVSVGRRVTNLRIRYFALTR